MAYTYSKAMGHNSGIQIPQYWALTAVFRAPMTHMVSAVGVIPLPFGKGRRWAQNGVVSKLVGGWQMSTVFVAHSGFPFSVTSSTATLNAPFSSQRADCIGQPLKISSIYQFYDKSAFAVPASGRFGTCGLNNLRGPNLINSDLGLQRRFSITERFQLSFRGRSV